MAYRHCANIRRFKKASETNAARCVQNLSSWSDAVEEIRRWPEYQPQPLRPLPNLATQLNINQLFFKDESQRFGRNLGSFKALGAPYAVYKILAAEVFSRTGIQPSSLELRSGKYRVFTQKVTVCVATDGNQGRGLAYGAKVFGCRCVNYIHNHVSTGRAEIMTDLGAIVIRIDGDYEASVERARQDARMNGWYFVSSTSWDDFEHEIPQAVMKAYMVLAEETLAMVPAMTDVTHVFVCGGVGSIAAAIFLGLFNGWRESLNKGMQTRRFIVVEPLEADCLFQSANEGQACESRGGLQTIMAGLACRSPSPAAWKVLAWLASDFLAVPDSFAIEGMKDLACGQRGDMPVVCGESSAAAVGVLLESKRDTRLRETLGLQQDSQVLLFGLEGATDAHIYEQLVGQAADAIFEAQSRHSM